MSDIISLVHGILQRIDLEPGSTTVVEAVEYSLQYPAEFAEAVLLHYRGGTTAAAVDADALRRELGARDAGVLRRTWKNTLGDQVVEPLELLTPRSLLDLIGLVNRARGAGVRVKAAGSGHSFSDVVQTTGFLVDGAHVRQQLHRADRALIRDSRREPMSDIDTMDPDVYDKKVLALDPASAIAIKRDVQTIDVGAKAEDMMAAFATTLQTPGKMFGLIQVLRTADKTGQPFTVGERFQGRYSIDDATIEGLKKSWLDTLAPGVAKLIEVLDLDRVFDVVENLMLSDYGLISAIDLSPPPGTPARFQYSYLEGTPIAGSLQVTVEATGPTSCRFTQVSEYQEIRLEVVLVFGTLVLKMHDQVFYEEVKQAAALLGAPILGTTIPAAYVRD